MDKTPLSPRGAAAYREEATHMPNGLIDYERVLNPRQLEAVMTLEGPLLVIAGAGSGKTRTLVYRVARLVERGIAPENILLLTFTRKASEQMLDRAAGLADERCRKVSGGTFHALAHRVLRRHAALVGFETHFTILDRADMEEAIQSLVEDLHVERGSVRVPKRATLANVLSKAANLEQSIEVLMKEEYAQFLEYIPQVNRLGELYRRYKRSNQLMDYDDLLLLFRKLLAENPTVRKELNETYRYILVDEYQDTNSIQADTVKWLAFEHGNIMVVGDDSQSIYSFRGANYNNMFQFPVLFPGARIIKLEENYRSTQPILSFTNAIMDRAQVKYTKCLFTTRGGGHRPRLLEAGTDAEQALSLSQAIREKMIQGRVLKDMAVLFRAAFHSFELELELTRQGIPFVKYGGFKFMESAHIKDVLAYLRVLTNRDDTLSWGRILRLIKNVGQKKSQAIIHWMRTNGCLPFQVSEWPAAGKGDEGLKGLSALLRELSSGEIKPAAAVELVMQYYDPILKERFDDFPRREKDLGQLISVASRYRKVKNFLDDLMLDPPTSSAELTPKEREDCLTLSTIHSAKGLEWPVVFIIWLVEGYFPSTKSYARAEMLEEERRLMYVAATRAKDELIMFYPGGECPPPWSLTGGSEAGQRGGLSSFIRDIPEGVYERVRFEGFGPRRAFGGFSPPTRRSAHEEGALQSLRPGDRVSHPAFGRGVISRFIDNQKVEVLFREVGRKLLHLGYTTLEKM